MTFPSSDPLRIPKRWVACFMPAGSRIILGGICVNLQCHVPQPSFHPALSRRGKQTSGGDCGTSRSSAIGGRSSVVAAPIGDMGASREGAAVPLAAARAAPLPPPPSAWHRKEPPPLFPLPTELLLAVCVPHLQLPCPMDADDGNAAPLLGLRPRESRVRFRISTDTYPPDGEHTTTKRITLSRFTNAGGKK